jgi:hypothetical protein
LNKNSEASDPPANTPRPFDPARLRLTQEAASVKRLVTTIPVRKPAKEWFVQAHPHEDYRLFTMILELKEDREIYLIAPSLRDALADEPCCDGRLLVTCINRQGTLFLWPIRLSGADGTTDEWSRSALEAVECAKSHWIRVVADMNLGAYDLRPAEDTNLTLAQWPSLSLEEILQIAFKDRYIDTLDHPVLRKLRGAY